MNKKFNQFVESQLHINETDFDLIIYNLPTIIREKENLDFYYYYQEDDYPDIERYLINKYILEDYGFFIDDFDVSTKYIWLSTFTEVTKEDLDKVKELLEDWIIEDYEDILIT